MNKLLTSGLLLASFFIFSSDAVAQCSFDETTGTYVTADGQPCPNTVLTAIPFLRIVPDARSGGLGNAGVALSPDGNSPKYNSSSTAFSDRGLGIGLSYTPWLRGITNDVELLMASGYYKWDAIQAFTFNFTYFSLGEIQYTGANGENLALGNPNEFSISSGYTRKLSDRFALSASAKYIYSNLASGQTVGGTNLISVGHAFSVDIGIRHEQPINETQNLTLGLSLQDIGTKISYIEGREYFIPANMALGANYTFQLDDYNRLSLIGEANKLMVPTPPLSGDSTEVENYLNTSSIEGVFKSFGDAPNGFSAELAEISYSLAMEYEYNKVLAIRAGYYHQSFTKGNIQYLTAGIGVNYNVYGINFSYLASTNGQASPLNNTLRFSLTLDFTYDNSNSTGS